MPRRVTSKATKPKTKPKRGPRWNVLREVVETAPLVEVKPTDPVWTAWGSTVDPDPAWVPEAPLAEPNAIVKITPPATATDSQVQGMSRSYYEQGAQSVKVMPAAVGDAIAVDDDILPEHEPDRPLRQVVMDRVDAAVNSRDQDALRELLTEAMDYAESK